MPIRINLLAEAKVAEELRRHDPVKRVIFCGAFLVALTLVWSSSLLLEGVLAKKAVTDRRTEIETRTNEYQHMVISQQKIIEVKQKLEAVKNWTDSRFLQGNLLNALQQAHVDGVRLTRLRVDQKYIFQGRNAAAKQCAWHHPGTPRHGDGKNRRVAGSAGFQRQPRRPGQQNEGRRGESTLFQGGVEQNEWRSIGQLVGAAIEH